MAGSPSHNRLSILNMGQTSTEFLLNVFTQYTLRVLGRLPFELFSPDDSLTISNSDSIIFMWTPSNDEDLLTSMGDNESNMVLSRYSSTDSRYLESYHLLISDDINYHNNVTVIYTYIVDTNNQTIYTSLYPSEDLFGENQVNFWKVAAVDNEGTITYSSSTRTLCRDFELNFPTEFSGLYPEDNMIFDSTNMDSIYFCLFILDNRYI